MGAVTVAATTRPRLCPWAWTALCLPPVLAGGAVFLIAAVRGAFAEAVVVGWVVASILALSAPTAAVVLGLLAARRHERSSWLAMALGVLALAVVAAVLPQVVRSPVALAIAALAYAIAMFAVIVFAQAAARRT